MTVLFAIGLPALVLAAGYLAGRLHRHIHYRKYFGGLTALLIVTILYEMLLALVFACTVSLIAAFIWLFVKSTLRAVS